MQNLSQAMVSSLSGKITSVPLYDRASLKPRLVHIGLGHFHRSHFLTYLDRLLGQGDYDGGVFEIDLVPTNKQFIDDLRRQDWLYSVLSWSADGEKEIRVNGPIMGYANGTEEPEVVLSHLVSAETELVTMTVTEKGYCYLDDKGTLDWSDKNIQHDLTGDGYPSTLVGWISLALSKRAMCDLPLTVMSCDNIPENGHVLEKCVLQFCEKKYPAILPWVNAKVAFPCTMVDRITPGTTPEDTKTIEEAAGYIDHCPVHSEDFLQWVIEDKKTTALPPFAKAGAMIVSDVKPYELMKIRLLNGSHSALSYPAYLMGIREVDKAATDPLIGSFIRRRYMEEITATLPPVPGIDVTAYKDKLISRFSNVSIRDTILRLASDGSKKISNAIVKPLEEAILKEKKHDAMVLALAFWARFCRGKDEEGNALPIDDPKKDFLLSSCHDAKRFLQGAGVSRLNAKQFDALIAQFNKYLSFIESKGVKKTLKEFLETT